MANSIVLDDGKYTIVNELSEGGGFYALRYGEEWRSLAGDKLMYAAFCEIERLRAEIQRHEQRIEFLTEFIRNRPDVQRYRQALERIIRLETYNFTTDLRAFERVKQIAKEALAYDGN